ncbi:TetR/AcrR family transcriptional regulator [Angustibacter sp. McL0619]|uniref:TetR/AcrR family transcriptional regulator n=1 Tax=Angustibacter sp. McL0619 TaxID=3415676 RepID=UPI003CEA3D57
MTTASPTAGVRGPYRNGVRRRKEIIDVAMEVFGEFGYAGGSIRTIADGAGVSPATVLQHFGSKEGLLAEVLDEWGRRTTEHGLTGSGLAYFRAFPALMEFHIRNRRLLELFITSAADASSPTHPAREFIQRRYADSLANLRAHLEQAVADGEVTSLSAVEIDQEARLITAVLDGLELQWLLDPSTDLAGLVSAYIDHTIARWQGGS